MSEKLSFVVILLFVLFIGTLRQADAAGSFSILYGSKSLNESDWEPVDSQSGLGFGFEVVNPGSPTSFVFTYLSTDDSAFDSYYGIMLNGETTEILLGIRRYLTPDKNRFFIEGGLASIKAEFGGFKGSVSASESDSATGYWVGFGMDFPVDRQFSVGLLGRISDADVKLFNVEGEAGGTTLGFFGAYHF